MGQAEFEPARVTRWQETTNPLARRLGDAIPDDPKAVFRRFAGGAYRLVGRAGRAAFGPPVSASAATELDEGKLTARTDGPDGAGSGPDPVTDEVGATRPVGTAWAPPRPDPATPPWTPLAEDGVVACNICRWHGNDFELSGHVEMTVCPGCGSNGRDRFMHWCFTERVALHPALRIIECSPRLGDDYRAAMSSWFFYRTSDLDMRAHRGSIRLDLQAIDLPDDSIDVMLCSHVLEHVPDTDNALKELHRVIAPGGHLILQVPVGQGVTAPPPEPEFHMDWTPVFWRFGFDLTDRLRATGFDTDLLCTRSLADAAGAGRNPWPNWSGEFDVPGMLEGLIPDDLQVVAEADVERRLGVMPGYMYFTWHGRVPPD